MPEQDEQIFGEIYNIYNKYRWHILTEQEMIALTNEVAAFAEIHRWKQNPLAYRLACAMVDVFNDFYTGWILRAQRRRSATPSAWIRS